MHIRYIVSQHTGMSVRAARATGCGLETVLVVVLYASIVINAGGNAATVSHSVVLCPGLEPTSVPGMLNCTAACQQTVCTALANFFNATYNGTNTALRPWRNRQGWDKIQSQRCDQILATPAAGGLPAYCDWYGITCCTGTSAAPLFYGTAPQNCTVLNSAELINLPVNGLNASITDAAFQSSITQLHACGMGRLNLAGNGLSGSLADFWGDLVNLTTLNLGKNHIHGTIPSAIRQLTKLVKLELERNHIMGTVPEWIAELPFLQSLGLDSLLGRNEDGRRGLIGTLPAGLASLTDLVYLTAGANSLTGSLPANLCHASLGVLDVRHNEIHGDMSQLLNCTGVWWLDISDNKFVGVLPDMTSMGALYWMDLSNNDLEGTIPTTFYQLPQLNTVNMADNRLNGTISNAIGHMPNFQSIDLAHNQLTGPLEDSIWYLSSLALVDLSGNMLTGTLSPAIGMSYYTSTVTLTNNRLTGRIPAEIGLVANLLSVDLRNTSLSCTGDTANGSSNGLPCAHGQMLPCFLRLTQLTLPRSDASNMECPSTVWKPHDEAVRDCSGSGDTQLGDLASNLADVDITTQRYELDPSYYQYSGCKCLGGYQAVWSRNSTELKCVPLSANTLQPWFIPTAVITTFIGICILGAAGLLVWLRVIVQYRWKWQRERDLLKYRLKGVPKDGPATIVVTDVESYSVLMQQNAAVTTRAMGIHNAIMRKAVTSHAGHVIEQEGDSWSVAFHRAVDAVAFCLQVQQALQRSPWPGDLAGPPALKNPVERYTPNRFDAPGSVAGAGEAQAKLTTNVSADTGNSATETVSASNKGDSQQEDGFGRRRSSSNLKASNSVEAPDSGSGVWRRQGLIATLLRRLGSGIQLDGAVAVEAASQNRGSVNVNPSDLTTGKAGRTTASFTTGKSGRTTASFTAGKSGRTTASFTVGKAGRASASFTAGKVNTPSVPIGEGGDNRVGGAAQFSVSRTTASFTADKVTRPSASSYGEGGNSRVGSAAQFRWQRRASLESAVSGDWESGVSETASKARRNSSITWLVRGKRTARKVDNNTVRGLKVRMGVVSGTLGPQCDVTRSPIFELAKAVSDMGNGGQVLIDHSTTMAARDWLGILGGVDHKGYNDQLILQAHRAGIKKQARSVLGFLSVLLKSPLSFVSQDRDPVLLDLGQYWIPRLASCIEAVTATKALDLTHKHTASPLAVELGRRSSVPFGLGHKLLMQLHSSNAAVAAAALAMVRGSEAAGSSNPGLQLHSITARPLHARSKLWNGKLNLAASTQKITKGYFDAPGTALSDLGPSGGFLDVERPLLPPVTMVFATVEGGKMLVRKKEKVAAMVHTVLVRTMQALLLSLPDGYLCREQEAVLKYMVAFKEPARAAEWCLMMQEVLQQIPWPQEVTEAVASLAVSPFGSMSGGRMSGSTAGMGLRPMLKMGMAEGVPDDISPDHLGRADYFGTCVNLAARIMSTAAGADQIAVCIETAESIFSTWRYEAEMGRVGGLASDNLVAARDERCSLDLTSPNSRSLQVGQLGAPENPQPSSHTAEQGDRSSHEFSGKPQGDRSSHEFSAKPQDGTSRLKLEPIASMVVDSENAMNSGARSPAALGPDCERQIMVTSLSEGTESDKCLVYASAYHIGTYGFKGCGAMDMVCLTSDALPEESHTKTAVPQKTAKGTLIMACSGPVLGLHDCPVTMPNILPDFRQAWANTVTNPLQPASPGPGSPRKLGPDIANVSLMGKQTYCQENSSTGL